MYLPSSMHRTVMPVPWRFGTKTNTVTPSHRPSPSVHFSVNLFPELKLQYSAFLHLILLPLLPRLTSRVATVGTKHFEETHTHLNLRCVWAVWALLQSHRILAQIKLENYKAKHQQVLSWASSEYISALKVKTFVKIFLWTFYFFLKGSKKVWHLLNVDYLSYKDLI